MNDNEPMKQIGFYAALVLCRLRNARQLQHENSGDDSNRQPDVNREDGRQSEDRPDINCDLANRARAVVRAVS